MWLLLHYTKEHKLYLFFITKRGQGAPAREPVISPEDQKQMMMYYSRREEELKVHIYLS